MAVTHSKVTVVSDGADSSQVRPSDWNDDHTIATVVPSAADTYDLGAAGTAWNKVYTNSVVTVDLTLDTGYTITGAGTSFPVSPSDGDRYFRTDLRQGMMFFWDDANSRWLSEQQFTHGGDAVESGYETSRSSAIIGFPDDFDLWITHFDVIYKTGTTHSGSHNWDFFLRSYQTDVNVWQGASLHNTGSESSSTFYSAHYDAVDQLVDQSVGPKHAWTVIHLPDAGSPSQMSYSNFQITYRLTPEA